MAALIILSFISPVFALPASFYGMKKDSRHWKLYAFLFGIFFAAIAYNYYPLTETDMIRYFEVIEKMVGKDLQYAFRMDSSNLYVQDIWFWLIAQTGNFHLIPAMSTFGVYFTGAYISNYLAYKSQDNRYIIWQLAMLACCLDLTFVISSVRNILAFALIMLGFFRWRVEEKRNVITVLLMVMPIWLHSTGLIFAALIIVLPVIRRFRWQSIVVALFSATIVGFFYQNNALFNNAMIRNILIKAYRYFNDEVASKWAAQLASSFTSRMVKYYNITMVVVILSIYLWLHYTKSDQLFHAVEKEKNKSIEMFNDYLLLIGVMVLCCIPVITPTYRRFYSAFMLGSAGILYSALKKNRIVKFFYIFSYIGVVKWMYSMSYEVNFPKLAGFFITNPFSVLIDCIFNTPG